MKQYISAAALFLALIFPISSEAQGVSSGDHDYIYSRALSLKAQGDIAKAIDEFSSLIPAGKELDHIYFQIASCYAAQPDYAKAQDFARKSIDADPSYTEPYQLIYDINMTLKNYENAADILEELTEENPQLVQFIYTKAALYYQNMNNLVLAEVAFRRILDLSKEITVPTYYKEQSYLILSDIHYQQKDYTKAIAMLDEAVKINPRNNVRYYRLASFFITNSYIDAARNAVERFIAGLPDSQKRNPIVTTMYAYLGNIYYITDDPRTLANLRKGAGTDNIDSFTAQYVFYASTGRAKEAQPVLEKLTAEYPKYITPYIALGRIYTENGDTDKAYTCFLSAAQLLYKTDMPSAAVRYYISALELKPESKDIHLILGQLYENMGNTALAALHYATYNEYKPDTEILLHLAYLYDNAGNRIRSDEYLARAFKAEPDSARVFFFSGVMANKNEKYSDAEKWLKKAVTIKNDDHNYFFYLAASQEKMKRQDDAISSLKKALELDPENPSYQNFLGYLYADANINLADSEALLEKALSQDPYNGAYLDSRGWLYYRQGKYDLALKKLHQARRMLAATDNPDPVVFDHIGDTYSRTGNSVKAVYYWKQSVSVKDDPAVRRKIDSVK